MIEIQITIAGDKETVKKLEKFEGALSDWQSELQSIGGLLQTFYSTAVYETEGGAFGAPWAQLSQPYEAWKRTAYPGRGILVRSGDMKRGYKYTAGRSEMKLWNPVDYAKFHQYGTSRMPQRLLLKLDDQRKNEIIKVIKKGVVDKIRQVL